MNKQHSAASLNLGFVGKWNWREIRHGQLWPITAATTLIIACVFALAALVIRVESVMTAQGRDTLAADLVLKSGHPISATIADTAGQQSLTLSQSINFRTMAFVGDNMQLVSVKAKDSLYPLRGQLSLSGAQQKQHLEAGEVWLQTRLFDLLNTKIGDTISLGDADFVVSGEIEQDPELSFNPFSQMPTVLIHLDDAPKTGAIQPGGRLTYQWYFTGSDDGLAKLKQSHTLGPSQKWLDQNSQTRTGDFINRAQQYLSLTLIMVILMSGATIVLTSQHFAASRQQNVAMMKSLGASKKWLGYWLTMQVAALFVISLIAGLSLGLFLEWALRLPIQDMLPSPLPSIGFEPAFVAIAVAMFVLLPAMAIAILNILATPATSLSQSSQVHKAPLHLRLAIGLVPVAALLFWFGENRFMWLTLAGIAVMLLVLGAMGLLVVKLLKGLTFGPAMTLAVSRMARSIGATSSQLAALTCSLMLLAVIWLLRSDVLADWQSTLPANAPNVFAANIDPHLKQDYVDFLDQAKIEHSAAYPVIRGRITHNNQTLLSDNPDINQDSALKRELNFTWQQELPDQNLIVAGSWMPSSGVSVERNIAKRLNIKLGDQLRFEVNSIGIEATVTSIRTVEWRNMKPNFYFIFSPDLLAELPSTWLLSFRLTEQQDGIVTQLARQFATVTLLDLRAAASQIQGMLQQIAVSLTVLAGLGVLSGLLLVVTLLRLSLNQRQQEIKLYRTLGASRKRISATLWSEYGLLAVIAGLMAVIGAELVIALVMHFGFELPMQWHPGLWLVLPLLAMAAVFTIIRSMIGQLLRPITA